MIDLMYRMIYRLAYPVMKFIWWVFDPPRQGTLVGVWYRGRILIIKNSYVRYFCLPGGYAKKGETPAQAAARELREEVGLHVEPSRLKHRPDLTPEARWAHRNNKLAMFELEVEAAPHAVVDRREVVSAELLTPKQALERRLFPQVRLLIESRVQTLDPSRMDSCAGDASSGETPCHPVGRVQ
jgi:8-oxo-dGTP diphosphatase